MIELIIDNVNVPIKKISFSDGGSNVRLIKPESMQPPFRYLSITVDPSTPVDNYFWEINQVLDAINHCFGVVDCFSEVFKNKYLYLPYLPHGRADRVFEEGNGNPLKLFMDTVVSTFDSVYLTDPHNVESVSHYGSVIKITSQDECFVQRCLQFVDHRDVLISPDKGALKKIESVRDLIHYRKKIFLPIVNADKKRDSSTGRVVETKVPEDVDLRGRTCWIIDDISDGGGTFIPLAEKLKQLGAAKVNLYVTHGIFAKGLDSLRSSIDNIYCYQIVMNYITDKDLNNFNKGEALNDSSISKH